MAPDFRCVSQACLPFSPPPLPLPDPLAFPEQTWRRDASSPGFSTMPPTLPCFRSPRGQCAAAAITISTSTSSSSSSDQSVTNTQIILSSSSSSESDQSLANTLVNLSSATFSAGGPPVVVVPDTPASRGGGGEARGGRGQERAAAPPGEARSAPRHRRPPSPAHSAVAVRSSTLVTVASSANGSGDVATSGRTTPAPRRSPSPCSVLCVRAPGGGGGGSSDDDEATSRPKKKYRKWAVQDERKILDTLAKLRRRNLGVAPQASVLLNRILKDGGLLRRGVYAEDIAGKVYKLKRKFVKTAARVAAGGRRRPRKFRDRVLYEASKEAWPDLV